jgi:O-antigen/teichoic acid export membrane protein
MARQDTHPASSWIAGSGCLGARIAGGRHFYRGIAPLYRQILGYIPSNLVPAVISILMVYVYTRLLSPAAFGVYSYVFSAVLVLQTSLFQALPIAVMRFYPGAAKSGREDRLLKEAYLIFYALAALVIVICAGIMLVVDLPQEYRLASLLAVPMLLFRCQVQLNQAVNRSADLMRRYNTIECVHAALGFGLGLVALYLAGPSPAAIVLGLLIGASVCSFADLRLLAAPFRSTATGLDQAELMRLLAYAWPLVAVAATATILQTSDRFMLGSMAGAGALGIFAVAYGLVERPTTLICTSISTTTFPLVVHVLEHEGKEAARLQAGRNGIALLALSLPACAGLALTADYVAATLVGQAFREGVAALLPIMCYTALARGLRAHFIDHAFHLSGRPLMMLWTYVPATILNIALNLYVVPRYGMFGAAWTALGCQWLTVVTGWFVGTSLFPVWLPLGQTIRCVLAVVPMSAALVLVRFPLNWFGLFGAVILGAAIYVASALALDVGNVRSLARARLRGRVRQSAPELAG